MVCFRYFKACYKNNAKNIVIEIQQIKERTLSVIYDNGTEIRPKNVL